MPEARFEVVGEAVTLRFDRIVVAQPSSVWSALVEPTILREWLADAEFDATVGGAVHLVWPGQGEMRGTVTACDAPSLIEYTWDESDGTSLVRFEISARDDDTARLRLIHSGMTNAGASGFGAGWQSHLEALDVVLAGGTSTADERNERYEALQPFYVEAVTQL